MIKFGTDGIRFIYDNISLFVIKAVSKAIKELLKNQRFVIGNDGRNSGEDIEKVFLSSFDTSSYERVGIVPSGCVSYITKTDFDFGVMITASHNDYRYNGIKFFDCKGQKISNQLEAEIEKLANQYYVKHINDMKNLVTINEVGNYDNENESQFENKKHCQLKLINNKLVQKYCDFIKNLISFDSLKHKKIIIDCANGGASNVIKKILDNENEYHIINTYVKFNKINKFCGATDTKQLRSIVVANKAYLGVAFDGDADRIVVVNKKGEQIDGGELFSYFAKNVILNNQKVVGTVYTNLGVIKNLNNFGIEFINGGVGDKNVIVNMNKYSSNFGGEPSGHYIFKDHLNTGDGLVSFAMLLNFLGYEKIRKVKTYYEVNKSIDKNDFDFIQDKVFDSKISELEKNFKDTKIVVRESGTEPIIRINVQNAKKNKALECALIVEELVGKSLVRKTI